MRFGVTVRSLLSTEVPTLHYALEALTLADGLDVNELAQCEVSRAKHVSDRQKVLWSDLELSHVSLGWQVVFQEVADLGSCSLLESSLAASNLDCIDVVAVLFELHLGDLASVDLYHGARSVHTPPVPEVSHTDLVSKQADSFGVSIDRLSCK